VVSLKGLGKLEAEEGGVAEHQKVEVVTLLHRMLVGEPMKPHMTKYLKEKERVKEFVMVDRVVVNGMVGPTAIGMAGLVVIDMVGPVMINLVKVHLAGPSQPPMGTRGVKEVRLRVLGRKCGETARLNVAKACHIGAHLSNLKVGCPAAKVLDQIRRFVMTEQRRESLKGSI